MAESRILSAELLRQLLIYNQDTGELFWKPRGPEWFTGDSNFSAQHRANSWNAKWAGKPALHCINPSGYRTGAVFNIRVQSHRAAYAIATGWDLGGGLKIDHINGDKLDNRLCNIRLVTSHENARNARLYKSNKTGVPGVIWEPSRKAWAVKISFNGKQRRIGRFKCFGQAVAQRKLAERQHGYHKNHGRITIAIGG